MVEINKKESGGGDSSGNNGGWGRKGVVFVGQNVFEVKLLPTRHRGQVGNELQLRDTSGGALDERVIIRFWNFRIVRSVKIMSALVEWVCLRLQRGSCILNGTHGDFLMQAHMETRNDACNSCELVWSDVSVIINSWVQIKSCSTPRSYDGRRGFEDVREEPR
jgi:hypothetical protein